MFWTTGLGDNWSWRQLVLETSVHKTSCPNDHLPGVQLFKRLLSCPKDKLSKNPVVQKTNWSKRPFVRRPVFFLSALLFSLQVPLSVDSQKLKVPNSGDYTAQKQVYTKRKGGKWIWSNVLFYTNPSQSRIHIISGHFMTITSITDVLGSIVYISKPQSSLQPSSGI